MKPDDSIKANTLILIKNKGKCFITGDGNVPCQKCPVHKKKGGCKFPEASEKVLERIYKFSVNYYIKHWNKGDIMELLI
jgi:hypothetical protein